MYNDNFIKNILKKYIDKQVNKFIIYPFGMNGVRVKNVMQDYFDLKPCFIVDNEYSKYNQNIIDLTELKVAYKKDMHIILTVENEDVNSKMFNELCEFIPSANIINLYSHKKEKMEYDGNGFLLKDFLPLEQVIETCRKKHNKVKVRISHCSPTIWNVINTVCQAFREDSIFDLLLIIDEYQSERSIRQAEKYGYKYIMCNEYSGEGDKPDILILCASFNKVTDGMLECRNYAKLIVVAYWSVIRYDESVELFWERIKKDFGIYRPDYYLFDSLQYKEIRDSNYFSEKIVELGNSKFDEIYHAVQKKQYIDGWDKLKGKITVLWTTTHGIDNMVIPKTLTFDLYARTVFEYADTNQEMGFIFRPHSSFVIEMLRFGFWSHEDLRRLKQYCADSSNIVYDDTETYDNAFSIADGVLTDAFCGIICSALPTLKPICAAYRSKKDLQWHPNLADSCYSAYESEDIIAFFEMLKNKQDPMLEIRKKASKEFIKHFDGKNGYRIKEFIKNKYIEREAIE